VLQVVSELQDRSWILICVNSSIMTRSTRSNSQADDITPSPPSLEEQFAGFHTVLQNVASRLTSIDARLENNEAQLKDHQQATTILTDKVTQLGSDVQKLQPNTTSIPFVLSQPINQNTDKSIPSPYQHPHARQSETNKPPSSHSIYQDNSRKDDDWRQPDSTPHWLPPRAEMTKFDGSNLIDWLEDCEYYFHISHTPDYYKVQTVIPFLTGDAREWHRSFKLTNLDLSWSLFKNELIDRFNPDFKNHVDEFKRIQQTGKVDDYINSYERIKARVSANKFSEEEFYLLGFLGGLKQEITDAIILHNPTTLKNAYKLARQIEKSLDSQQKLFKPLTRTMNSAQPYSQTRTYKPKDDTYSSKPTDTMAPKPLSIEQKKTLGLCFRCGERYFVGHKCQNKGLHVLEDEELLCTKELSLEETSHEFHDHSLDNT
jgi:Ty3 transposon capsid-like protein